MGRTVTQILARPTRSERTHPLYRGQALLLGIDALIDELSSAAQPADQSDDWQMIYKDVFSSDAESIGERARAAFRMTGTAFPDYYDPDGDYDEDVQAWMRAFKEGLKEVSIKVAEHEAASGSF